jgi:pimeloyl-ACP methyl ester carboxylesterase
MKMAYGYIMGLVLAVLWGCDGRNGPLYYPGSETLADIQRYAAENGLMLWPGGNGDYQGIRSRRGPANAKGTVVIFHGDSGPAVFRDYFFPALESRGYRVILMEYPGYGGRPGELSEASFVADARVAVLRAKKEFGDPLYVWGESLGCGVAAAIARDAAIRPRGVVLLTPWDSLLNEAKAHYPWLPVSLFLRDRYDNAANMAGYQGPVAVIMSGRDEIVPNRLTERLYRELSAPKRLWTFENAGHNDWPVEPDRAWWTEVMDFLSSER